MPHLKRYVVVLELTYNDGARVHQIDASDPHAALRKAYMLNGIDPERLSKFVRNKWVVEGDLAFAGGRGTRHHTRTW